MTVPLISVVIPVLNEQTELTRILQQLEADGSAPFETIVADGGSMDATEFLARAAGAHVTSGVRGRGQQLAAGAAAARGDVIWFLHVDSLVTAGSLGAIRKALDEKGATGGNFRLFFDGDDRFSRWLTGFYAWFRGRGLYYGDSGIFIRRDVLDRIGGIRPIALMEDYDLSRRMERYGGTCCIDVPALGTSSRKFANRHPVVIFYGWMKMHALYALGVSPGRLARIYYRR